jgi:hypothetical protein
MTEQMPGELIYEYTIQSTGATSYGVPALDALLSGVADIPPQGARYDLAFRGPIVGQRLRGTVELTDYIHIRPDGRVQLTSMQRSRPRMARRSRSMPMASPTSRRDHPLATCAKT